MNVINKDVSVNHAFVILTTIYVFQQGYKGKAKVLKLHFFPHFSFDMLVCIQYSEKEARMYEILIHFLLQKDYAHYSDILCTHFIVVLHN